MTTEDDGLILYQGPLTEPEEGEQGIHHTAPFYPVGMCVARWQLVVISQS